MNDEDLATLIALTELQGIGDSRALELFRSFETRTELQASPRNAFKNYSYVDADTHEKIQELAPTVDEYCERFQRYRRQGINVIGIDDDRYPAPLRHHHAPLVLYAKGNVARLFDPAVSVSGSRETNKAGQTWIRDIARELSSEGYTIISGGAHGTDTAAHKGALDSTGATIAVLGTGVNTPYPEENTDMFSDIVDKDGLLLSHRPPQAEPTRYAFLDRNKTISVLSPGIIIVATDGSGGTMAQYETALDQGRQIFVPEAGQQIRPNSGLKKMRTAEATTVVSSTDTIKAAISEAHLDKNDRPIKKKSAASENIQTSLDEW